MRVYNFIYEKIVNEPDDIVGLIAYGLYKRKKIDHIKAYKDKHGQAPTEEELSSFHEVSVEHLSLYRNEAEIFLGKFSEDFTQSYLLDLNAEYEEELKNRLKGTFKSNVCASVVGSVLTGLLIGAMVFVLMGFSYGFGNTIKMFINKSDVRVEQSLDKDQLQDLKKK